VAIEGCGPLRIERAGGERGVDGLLQFATRSREFLGGGDGSAQIQLAGAEDRKH
jgi:hypothetical protein